MNFVEISYIRYFSGTLHPSLKKKLYKYFKISTVLVDTPSIIKNRKMKYFIILNSKSYLSFIFYMWHSHLQKSPSLYSQEGIYIIVNVIRAQLDIAENKVGWGNVQRVKLDTSQIRHIPNKVNVVCTKNRVKLLAHLFFQLKNFSLYIKYIIVYKSWSYPKFPWVLFYPTTQTSRKPGILCLTQKKS